MAYDATVQLVGPKGSRLIPLQKLYVLPNEDVQRETVLKRNEIVTEIFFHGRLKGFAVLNQKSGPANHGILLWQGSPLRWVSIATG